MKPSGRMAHPEERLQVLGWPDVGHAVLTAEHKVVHPEVRRGDGYA